MNYFSRTAVFEEFKIVVSGTFSLFNGKRPLSENWKLLIWRVHNVPRVWKRLWPWKRLKKDLRRPREEKHSTCCVPGQPLLSVVCCIALIHLELRIQEHHRLISHSVTSCDQMETEIIRKLQLHNYENWQATKESHLGGHLQKTRGIKWRLLLFLSFCTAIIVFLGGESYQTSFQILK